MKGEVIRNLTEVALVEMSNPHLLSEHVKRQIKRKPYHTFDGKNLITENNKMLSERKVKDNE